MRNLLDKTKICRLDLKNALLISQSVSQLLKSQVAKILFTFSDLLKVTLKLIKSTVFNLKSPRKDLEIKIYTRYLLSNLKLL